MKEKDVSAVSVALREELVGRILGKIEAIKNNIDSGRGASQESYLQMLMMIDEDLDDVLLNWEYDMISSRRISSYLQDPIDDFDEDDDF